MIHEHMSAAECRTEALRLAAESVRLFADYQRTGDRAKYDEAAALRQLGALLSPLAAIGGQPGATDGDDQGATA